MDHPLYQVVDIGLESDRGQASVRLNQDHPVYQGHFPTNPIIPGACLVRIGTDLLNQQINSIREIAGISRAKFYHFVRPWEGPLEVSWQLGSIQQELGNAKVKIKLAEQPIAQFIVNYTI